MKRIITITGELGSGKSSVCSHLNRILGYEIEYVGSILRKLAQDYGMSTNDFNKYIEAHPEVDNQLDERVAEMGRQGLLRIYDSRLAWHFIPTSFKVYLYVDVDTAAKRVLGDTERVNEKHGNLKEAREKIIERRESEIVRYKNLYDVVLDNFDNYDLVVNTSNATVEEIVGVILDCYEAYKEGREFKKIWFND